MNLIANRKFEFTLLTGVLIIGIFLRFYQLDSIPGGLYADVAANGLDGLNTADGSDIRILYPRNGGREGMFFWLLGILQNLVTKHYAVIYLLTAIIGSLTLIVHYQVIKDFLGRRTALLGTFLLATSFYHLLYSRMGYRTILVPIFILGTFYGTRKMLLYSRRREWAIASGFIFGLGIYTYLSYRTFILAVFLSLAYYYHTYKADWPIYKANFKYFTRTFLLTISPFLLASILDLNAAFGRTVEVGSLGFIPGIIRTLKIFGLEGEFESPYNIPGQPLMSIFLATFFVLGFIFLLKKYWRKYEFAFIFLTVGSQLGIVVITDRVPHLLRAVGMTSFIYAITAYGFIETLNYLQAYVVKKEAFNIQFIGLSIFGFFSMIYFLILPAQAYHQYFNIWSTQENIWQKDFYTDYIALGQYLSSSGLDLNKVTIMSTYFKDDVYWWDSYPLQTTKYILGTDNPAYNIEWLGAIGNNTLRKYVFLKLNDEISLSKFLETRDDYKFYDLVYYSKDPQRPVYSVYIQNSK